MSERYPGGLIRKTPPTVTGPATSGIFAGEGGSASGVWTLADVLTYEKVDGWPKPVLPRSLYALGGENAFGQLGDGTVIRRSSPVQIGALTNWAQVTAGEYLSGAVKMDGTLWTWGDNSSGGLGDNTNILGRSSPVQIGALTNWLQASVGKNFGAAVKIDGTMWTWGLNNLGQLGSGTNLSRSSPVQVGALTNWSNVGAANYHCVALKSDGSLWAWGLNNSGQLAQNDLISRSSPVQIGALTNWLRFAAGTGTHTAAVKTDGTLWGWGGGLTGQIGDGTVIRRSSPVQIGALTNWAQVAVGQESTFSVKSDGTLWAWGINDRGQLGDGTVANKSSPVQIGALANWSQVSGGRRSALSIKIDGTLWGWGANGSGQLGQNNAIYRSSPVQVGALTNWAQVAAGWAHTIATTKG